MDKNGFNGIEERLQKLEQCLVKLKKYQELHLTALKDNDEKLDIILYNFQIAIQCCIDIANKIISENRFEKPKDFYGSIKIIGNNEIIPSDFADQLAPITGFRNILVHEYTGIDWDQVQTHMKNLNKFEQFIEFIKDYLKTKS